MDLNKVVTTRHFCNKVPSLSVTFVLSHLSVL
jgi:hypothetical protein